MGTSTPILLADSTINIDEYSKFKNNFKIITFDYTTHLLLLQNKIEHEISDQYISKSDLDDILNHSMICARWYMLPEIKEIISFKGINLGELFYIELHEFLISFLKQFLEIKQIFNKFPDSKFTVSQSLSTIISSFSNNVEIIGTTNEQLSIYDKLDVPIKIGKKQLTLSISSSNVKKIQKITEKLTQVLIKKTQLKSNSNTVLLVDFSTIKSKPLLQSIQNFQLNIVKYDRHIPSIWNAETYSIIRKSNCILENYSSLNDKSLRFRITQNQDFLNKKIDQIMMNEKLLSTFFSFSGMSFWNGMKIKFVNMCRKRFFDASKEFELAEKLFEKYHFSTVLILAETGLTQQIIISLAKKFKIPVMLLQHGLDNDSTELIKRNNFYGAPPKLSDIHSVWGTISKECMVKSGLNKNSIFEIGNPFSDPIFNNIIKPAVYENYILFATDPFALMNSHELTVEFMETYALIIKKVYEISFKHNMKLIIKPHPQKNSNEEEIIKQIDPTIIIIKSGDILPLIKSSSLVLVTDISTVLLETQSMKKPVTSIILRDYYGIPESFKSNPCERINIDELDKWVTKILTSNDFKNNVILQQTRFIDSYFANQGKASKSLLKFLEKKND